MHEFLAVVTHPRIFTEPTPTGDAVHAVMEVIDSTGVRLLGEGQDHLVRLGSALAASGVAGAKVHDARIAAICLAHGVRALWTADRDFSYFPELTTRNPLVGQSAR